MIKFSDDPKGLIIPASDIEAAREKSAQQPRVGLRLEKRAQQLVDFSEALREHDASMERSDAIKMARVIAMAGLPKKPSKEPRLTRTLRLGLDLWVRITYMSTDGILPYGQDRLVLAGIIHLALEQNDPVVFFDTAGQILKMFGIAANDQGYRLLRERFRRISRLSISIQFGDTEADIGSSGQNFFVIGKYTLPTRNEIAAERNGQMNLPTILEDPAYHDCPYGVRLGADLWDYAKDPSNHLLVPLKLLRPFVDMPAAWDFCVFLVARCGAARRVSIVPHDVVLSLFRDGSEEDRNVIRRLKQYLAAIEIASDGRIKAEFEETSIPTARRPRKAWNLKVFPMQGKIIWSGKKPGIDYQED